MSVLMAAIEGIGYAKAKGNWGGEAARQAFRGDEAEAACLDLKWCGEDMWHSGARPVAMQLENSGGWLPWAT
jgi:hypothetical protein